MKKMITGVTLAFLLMCSIVGNVSADIVDTVGVSLTPPWSFGSFGEGSVPTITSTVGQTFKLNSGDDTLLKSFTFYLKDYDDPDYIDFAAYLYEWDGNKAIGSSLYSGSMLSTTDTGAYSDTTHLDDWESFTVNTGSVLLEENKDYVFFISASNFFDGLIGTGRLGLTPAASYSNGTFARANTYNNFGDLLNIPWTIETYADLAFTMETVNNPVPIPSTMLLLGTGIVGLAGIGKKKKR